MLALVREAWPHVRPLAVCFSHARREVAPYCRHFQCPVHFGTEANEIHYLPEVLKSPARQPDPNLTRVLEAHTEEVLAQLPRHERFVEVAQHQLRVLLERGDAGIEALARALHLGERTLRRRLQSEGTTYHTLLDELRRSLALERIAHEEVSVEQLAANLLFADTSAFYRAFRRWTGTTRRSTGRTGWRRKRSARGAAIACGWSSVSRWRLVADPQIDERNQSKVSCEKRLPCAPVCRNGLSS